MTLVTNVACIYCDGYVNKHDSDGRVTIPICCLSALGYGNVCSLKAAQVQAGEKKLEDWNI